MESLIKEDNGRDYIKENDSSLSTSVALKGLEYPKNEKNENIKKNGISEFS